MPNYYLSVLYKHIIQVENKNVGEAQTYPLPTPMCVSIGIVFNHHIANFYEPHMLELSPV